MNLEFPKVSPKLAFLSFEQTLVHHPIQPRDPDYFTDCLCALTLVPDGQPLPCMQWYAKKLFRKNYGLYCLSTAGSNLYDRTRQAELARHYPDVPMTFLTTDCPEHKVDLIRAVAAVENYDPGDILFVDDDARAVADALKAGIDAKHLSEIVLLYETGKHHQEQARCYNPAGVSVGISDADLEQAYQECCSIVAQGGIIP